MKALGLSLLLVLGFGISAEAATFYLSTTGTNTTCTTATNVNTPARTFAFAAACLTSGGGHTLFIRAGNYPEFFNFPSGTAGAITTVSGYPGDARPVFNMTNALGSSACTFASFALVKDLIFDGVNGAQPNINTENGCRISSRNTLTLQNVEIKNWVANGVYIEFSNTITIRNCQIHDQRTMSGANGTRWYGLYFHEFTTLLVEDTEIYNNPGGGMQIDNGSGGNLINGVILRRNSIHHNNFIGTLYGSNAGSSNVGGITVSTDSGISSQITNVQIYNNLLYSNAIVAGAGGSCGIDIGFASGTLIANNTSYGNSYCGLRTNSGATGSIARNNILYANGTHQYENVSGTTQSNNICQSGCSTANSTRNINPLLTNAGAADFTLQAGSPARDTGFNMSSVYTTDYASSARVLPFDIGAYEFGATDTTAPAAPTGVTIT
jgi:hypothetical protein